MNEDYVHWIVAGVVCIVCTYIGVLIGMMMVGYAEDSDLGECRIIEKEEHTSVCCGELIFDAEDGSWNGHCETEYKFRRIR